jgi:MFS family permease
VAAGTFVVAVVAVITPELIEIYSFTASEIGLLTSVLMLAGCLAWIPMGVAAARWGGRTLGLGIALMIAGSVVFALSSSLGGFLAARLLQGAGAAALVPTCTALVARDVVPRLRQRVSGICAAGAGLGVLLAMLVMPSIQGAGGYRTVSLAAAGILLLLGGGALAHPAVRAIPAEAGEGASVRAAWRALGPAASSPRLWLLALMNSGAAAVAVCLVVWTPIFLQDQKGVSLAVAAYLSAGLGVAHALGGQATAGLSARLSRPLTLFVSLALVTVLTALVPAPAATAAAFILFSLAMFFSATVSRPSRASLLEIVTPGGTEPSAGFLGLTAALGTVFAPWLYGVALDAYGTGPRDSGYQTAFLVAAAFAAVGVGCALLYLFTASRRPA